MPAEERKVHVRSRLSARQWNWLVDAASREVTGPLAFSDGVGSYGRRPLPAIAWEFVVLMEDLTTTAGVAKAKLKYWDGDDFVEQETEDDVYAPPMLGQTIPEDTEIRVAWHVGAGRWYVVGYGYSC